MAIRGPHGILVDANIIQKRLGRLIRLLQRDAMTDAKALATEILDNVDAMNDSIQAATLNTDLSADPTLPLRDNDPNGV